MIGCKAMTYLMLEVLLFVYRCTLLAIVLRCRCHEKHSSEEDFEQPPYLCIAGMPYRQRGMVNKRPRY